MPSIKVLDKQYEIDGLPRICPVCGHAVHPEFQTAIVVEQQSLGYTSIDVFFQCPQQSCHRGFIGRYSGHQHSNYSTTVHKLFAALPFVPQSPPIPEVVAKLSKQFAEIFVQAARAEGYGLHQVSGCGYRKSLEFLVKDYCISLEPEAEAKIKSKQLGAVISDHVADVNIKECARRAAWLGNDETHYLRVWATKDIEDLKMLIQLTVSWINTSLLTKQYLDSMPRG